MAGPVIRDEDGRAKAVRHPCTVGHQKAAAAGPGKVNGGKTKKARVASSTSAVRRHKTRVKASKAAAKTAKAQVRAAKGAAKTAGKTAGRQRPC